MIGKCIVTILDILVCLIVFLGIRTNEFEEKRAALIAYTLILVSYTGSMFYMWK